MTILFMALLSLLFIALSVNVIKGRRSMRIAIGDDAQHEMTRRIRAHGNFAEYTPLFLILLYAAENHGASAYSVSTLGILFIMGRVFHAYSLLFHEQYENSELKSKPKWRVYGMMITFGCILFLAGNLIYLWQQHL